MLSIYDVTDYRQFLNAYINTAGGRGLKGKLAKACNVSSTMISLILKGDKHLSQEQASDIIDFIGLNDYEADYFFLLVHLGRAGTYKLQQKLQKRMLAQQEQARKISRRVKKDIKLSDETKAIYYSSWIYTGIRNLSALNEYHDIHTISVRLNLPVPVVAKAIDFLIEHGLCRTENGHITYGPAYTHVDSDSPFVVKHHQNWRLKGFSIMDSVNESNLFYTCPMSLSGQVAEEVRKLLPKVIEQIQKLVTPSPSEKVCCLNIDWFEY